MADFPVGDPRDAANVIRPMVSERQWERVQSYIRRGVEKGARIVAGADAIDAARQTAPGRVRVAWFVA